MNTTKHFDKSRVEMSAVMSKFSGYLGNEFLSLKSSKLINLIAPLSLVSFFSCLRVSSLDDNCFANFPFCGVEEPDPMMGQCTEGGRGERHSHFRSYIEAAV